MKFRSITVFCIFFSIICSSLFAQEDTFDNPIIPGFHPDPSICRVGDDYYLVTSSFEWFPGIPLYHSKDLMNWKQIGHVLDRSSQLAMRDGLKNSAGLWAPTIRHHKGKFYVICTAQQAGGNFLVVSDKVEGPYSEPVFIKNAQGIDPSLFFDDDGSCWYTGSINGTPKEDRYPNEDKIYLQQLDLDSGELVGERHILTTGQATNSPFSEAPHIYKIRGKYYLLIAEGGTWNNHAITLFTSDKVTGPYVPGIANPVLTHRHLGNKIDITGVGHGDLVQTQNGDWWCVMLGVRPYEGFNLLGRETFLTPVEFQASWPVFNPGVGRVLAKEKITGLTPHPFSKDLARDEFDIEKLSFNWNFLRTPFEKWYRLENGELKINLRPEKITDPVNPSFVARRIQHFCFDATTKMNFKSQKKDEEAGIAIVQNGNNFYKLTVKRFAKSDSLILTMRSKGVEHRIAAKNWKGTQSVLKLSGKGLNYQFYVGENEANMEAFAGIQNATVCSSNHAGGFIGPFVGMYASSNGVKSKTTASFDFFEYKEAEKASFPKLKTGSYTLKEIAVRDPFIFADSASKKYYLYAATREESDRPNGHHGVKVYSSTDLKNWTGSQLVYQIPTDSWADCKHGVWAPEVHFYNGKYYLFATLTNENKKLPVQKNNRPTLVMRGSQIFVSDLPEGPFRPFENKPTTPSDWMALDGTLWVENGKPYMVFCHEWIQKTDGTIDAVELSSDLSKASGRPFRLFKATDASWVKSLDNFKGQPTIGYVTDGCYLHKNRDGKLMMLWSSFGNKGYAVSTAVSESGKLSGPWKQRPEPLFAEHGGHAMFFTDFDGRMIMTLHYPNSGSTPHCRMFEIKEANDTFEIIGEIK